MIDTFRALKSARGRTTRECCEHRQKGVSVDERKPADGTYRCLFCLDGDFGTSRLKTAQR
jgi:hypothetical protein